MAQLAQRSVRESEPPELGEKAQNWRDAREEECANLEGEHSQS